MCALTLGAVRGGVAQASTSHWRTPTTPCRCRSYVHPPAASRGTEEMDQPLSNRPARHLFGSAQISHIRLQRVRQLLGAPADADGPTEPVMGTAAIDVDHCKGVLRDHLEGSFLHGPNFNAALPVGDHSPCSKCGLSFNILALITSDYVQIACLVKAVWSQTALYGGMCCDTLSTNSHRAMVCAMSTCGSSYHCGVPRLLPTNGSALGLFRISTPSACTSPPPATRGGT